MKNVYRIITYILIVLLCCACVSLCFAVHWIVQVPELPASPTVVPTTIPTATPRKPTFVDGFDLDTWSYYKEIALISEYSALDQNGLIKKWNEAIRIYVDGLPTLEDRAIIQRHVAALNEIPGVPDISIEADALNCNMTISFITQKEMNTITKDHNEVAFGYTMIWWNYDAQITKAKIYIVRDRQKQIERQHTILEEMTQALGLMNDSARYDDSIFYIYYSDSILRLSKMDWDLIRIHYCDDIVSGMTAEDVSSLYTPK